MRSALDSPKGLPRRYCKSNSCPVWLIFRACQRLATCEKEKKLACRLANKLAWCTFCSRTSRLVGRLVRAHLAGLSASAENYKGRRWCNPSAGRSASQPGGWTAGLLDGRIAG